MKFPDFLLTLPSWVEDLSYNSLKDYSHISNRMALAIELSKMNTEHKTGGPFGAAIFNLKNHQLISMGVNLVEKTSLSILHAEIVAITMAQKKIGSFDLSLNGETYELVTSSEPCAMCFGAIPWSGIKNLLCGATSKDVAAIGFDEGVKVSNWVEELNKRAISVTERVCQKEAIEVLNQYKGNQGTIY